MMKIIPKLKKLPNKLKKRSLSCNFFTVGGNNKVIEERAGVIRYEIE
jgi:hypothetical protein